MFTNDVINYEYKIDACPRFYLLSIIKFAEDMNPIISLKYDNQLNDVNNVLTAFDRISSNALQINS